MDELSLGIGGGLTRSNLEVSPGNGQFFLSILHLCLGY